MWCVHKNHVNSHISYALRKNYFVEFAYHDYKSKGVLLPKRANVFFSPREWSLVTNGIYEDLLLSLNYRDCWTNGFNRVDNGNLTLFWLNPFQSILNVTRGGYTRWMRSPTVSITHLRWPISYFALQHWNMIDQRFLFHYSSR